jgi:hypothetical protein
VGCRSGRPARAGTAPGRRRVASFGERTGKLRQSPPELSAQGRAGQCRPSNRSPLSDLSLFGDASPLPLEGNLAGGDSGSALFWNNYLVGIGAYVFCATASNCIPASTFGNGSLWVRLDVPENVSFLQANGITVVPLAGALLPFLSAFAALLTLARARKT